MRLCSLLTALALWAAVVPATQAEELSPALPNAFASAPPSALMSEIPVGADNFHDSFVLDPNPGSLGPGAAGVLPSGVPLEAVVPILPWLPSPAEASASALNFYKSGVDEYNRNEYDQAIAYFDEALRLIPVDAVFYYSRGNAYFARGKDAMDKSKPADDAKAHADYDRALGDLFDSILRDPNRSDSYLLRARIYGALRVNDKALADYNIVLRIAPKNTEAFKKASNERCALITPEKPPPCKPAAAQAPCKPAAADPSAAPAPAPAPSSSSPLQSVLDQAAIEDVKVRIQAAKALQEKANLDAEMYRRQRFDKTKPADQAKSTPPDLQTTVNNEALKAQLEVMKALEEKAKLEAALARFKWLELLNSPGAASKKKDTDSPPKKDAKKE